MLGGVIWISDMEKEHTKDDTFPKDISPKVNVAWLEFELAYMFSHYTTKTHNQW